VKPEGDDDAAEGELNGLRMRKSDPHVPDEPVPSESLWTDGLLKGLVDGESAKGVARSPPLLGVGDATNAVARSVDDFSPSFLVGGGGERYEDGGRRGSVSERSRGGAPRNTLEVVDEEEEAPAPAPAEESGEEEEVAFSSPNILRSVLLNDKDEEEPAAPNDEEVCSSPNILRSVLLKEENDDPSRLCLVRNSSRMRSASSLSLPSPICAKEKRYI